MAAAFTVVNIIDANTIQVSPSWNWNNLQGNLVKISGYDASASYQSIAITKLRTLLFNKQVDLKNAYNTILSSTGNTINCSVFLNEIDIAHYFPELRKVP